MVSTNVLHLFPLPEVSLISEANLSLQLVPRYLRARHLHSLYGLSTGSQTLQLMQADLSGQHPAHHCLLNGQLIKHLQALYLQEQANHDRCYFVFHCIIKTVQQNHSLQ